MIIAASNVAKTLFFFMGLPSFYCVFCGKYTTVKFWFSSTGELCTYFCPRGQFWDTEGDRIIFYTAFPVIKTLGDRDHLPVRWFFDTFVKEVDVRFYVLPKEIDYNLKP